MSDFDVIFDRMRQTVLDESDTASITLSPSPMAHELEEIDEIRRFSADVLDPEPMTYAAAKPEHSADIMVHFRNVLD